MYTESTARSLDNNSAKEVMANRQQYVKRKRKMLAKKRSPKLYQLYEAGEQIKANVPESVKRKRKQMEIAGEKKS